MPNNAIVKGTIYILLILNDLKIFCEKKMLSQYIAKCKSLKEKCQFATIIYNYKQVAMNICE